MQGQETIDFREIDVIKPTPKQVCTRTHGECTSCKYDAPHASTTPSDWSSEDWDGEKAKAREQCPLLDFNLLERQLQQTLQDLIQDTAQDTLDDHMTEKSLSKDLQALTLKDNVDKQNLADTQVMKPKEPEDDNKVEEIECKTPVLKYEMTKQELQVQIEEEKYRVYMSTFGYKGDNSDLDSEMDMESKSHAYPYLD